MKNVTISLDEEVAHWARRKAADENTSVSKLIGRMLDREMRSSDAYWRAYEEWKKLPRDLGVPIDASKRMTRDEAHERG
ncbi:MAG: CopG family transcriptional regulator [Bryobacteraceae bacterium]